MVTRKDLVGGVKVPPEELLDILCGLARRLPGMGWEFKCKQDAEFLLGHLEVVAKQLEWWRGRQERYQAGEGIESVVVRGEKEEEERRCVVVTAPLQPCCINGRGEQPCRGG